MSLVLTAPANNFAPPATMKAGLHQVVISNIEDLGMVPLSAETLAKNRAQAQREGRDPNSVKTEQPKARFFFSNSAGDFITKDYTVSLSDNANLKKDFDPIRPLKYGDSLLSLLGVQLQLMAVSAVSKKGKGYVKIGTITTPAPGQNVNVAVKPVTPKQSIPTAVTTGVSLTPAEIPF